MWEPNYWMKPEQPEFIFTFKLPNTTCMYLSQIHKTVELIAPAGEFAGGNNL